MWMELATFGKRVRHARLACGLTQAEFAKAIARLTHTLTVKGLVSQWENDKIANPNNATLLAIQAVTGHAAEWLVSGRGEQKVRSANLLLNEPAATYGKGITREILHRAIVIAASEKRDPVDIADAAIEVVETLADEPGIPDAVLKRIARLTKTAV